MSIRKHAGKKNSILLQVAALFVVGILTTGLLTYFVQYGLAEDGIARQTEQHASEIAEEVRQSVMEYPAYSWLLRYWYEHADSMEVEYDVAYGTGTQTEDKATLLTARYAGLQLKYLTAQELAAMPPEDQRLCAEVAYSWLITRINQIKRTYHIDYLFCVASGAPYDTQFFLFSGAEQNAVRGTAYEEVYPLGHVVTVAESQQTAMRSARASTSYLADAGDYVDYYTYLCSFDEEAVFIGMTFGLGNLRESVKAQTRTGTTYAVLNQLLLSLLCLGLISLFVLRPLKNVQKNIRLYRQTKDSGAVVEQLSEIRSDNEIGDLAEDVSDLALELDEHMHRIRDITAEKERIGTELALATRIQAAMLPHVFPPYPERPEFEIYAGMDPAKEVGGDFYDFYLIDDDHLCMVIADVSGKGVPAALFMMAAKIILQSCARQGKSPADILTMANDTICANNPENMFITAWVGILELSTGRLSCANAGHEYPVLQQPDGSFVLYKDKHGFVLGGMEGMRYRAYELQLQPGSRIFVYTDGVPEATDAAGGLFGTERMLAALNTAQNESPEGVLKAVRSAVDAFVQQAEQFDDLTMLCLRYCGPKAPAAEDTEK